MFNSAGPKTQRGFTIIELMVAIFILGLILAGVQAVLVRVLAGTSLASSKLIAAYLAQEGMEIVRNIRDTNWLRGSLWDNNLTGCQSLNNYYCEADYNDPALIQRSASDPNYPVFLNLAAGFYSYDAGNATPFKRKITIDLLPGTSEEDLLVTVQVIWSQQGQDQQVTVKEKLYNWKQ